MEDGKETQAVAVAKIMEHMPKEPSVPSTRFKAFVKRVVRTVTIEEWAFPSIIEILTTRETSHVHESKGIIYVNNNEAFGWERKIESLKAARRYDSWCANHGSVNPIYVELNVDGDTLREAIVKVFGRRDTVLTPAEKLAKTIKLYAASVANPQKEELRETDENTIVRDLVEGSFYGESPMENPSLMEPENPVIKLEQDLWKQEEDTPLEDQYKVPEPVIVSPGKEKEYVQWSQPGKNMPGTSKETQVFEKEHVVKDWMVTRKDTKRKNKTIEELKAIVAEHINEFYGGWDKLGLKENRKLLIRLYYEKTGKVLDGATLRRYIKEIVPPEEIEPESHKAWKLEMLSLRKNLAMHTERVNSVAQ